MADQIHLSIPKDPMYGDICLLDPMFGITAYWNGKTWVECEIYNDQGEVEAEITGLRVVKRTTGICQLGFDYF